MPGTPGRGQGILLVDDHAGFRQMVAAVLRLEPGQFREAADGAEAVSACKHACPDLIVMDWEMPTMDGIAATRRILSEHPHARIVILTQHDEPLLRELAFEAGAQAFVSKDDLAQLPGIVAQGSR